MVLTASTMMELGKKAPDFDLPDVVSGKRISLSTFQGKKALLIMFICRHCPYVQHVKHELAKIGKDYLLPRALAASGLVVGDIVFPDEIWHTIVRPLGFDAGMRTLDRTISGICRKVAKLKVEGKAAKITLTEENLKEYLPS